MWTLELQRWPHTSDACGLCPDDCVMAARLHVCSLGTLELEGALLPEPTLTTIYLGLDGWHTILLLHLTPRDHGCLALSYARGKQGSPLFEGDRAANKNGRVAAGLMV